MPQIILLTHGALGDELLRTLSTLMGEPTGITALGLGQNEAPEAYQSRLNDALSDIRGPETLLLLTDVPGGTPHQVGLKALQHARPEGACAVISGVNLGMLCEAWLERKNSSPLAYLVEHLVTAGVEQICGDIVRP